MQKKSKIFSISLLLCVILVVTGCGKKEVPVKRREISSELDKELIKKLSGTWLGEGEKEKKIYDIQADNKEIKINDELLEVTETDNNWVKSQTKSGKIFFYDFEINEKELTVYPSFPVEEGQVGGVLAPFKLKPIESQEISVRNSNKEEMKKYEDTLKNTAKKCDIGETFLLKITQYTHEGDPIVESISFDGKIITYHHDNSKDSYGEKNVFSANYKQMKWEDKGTDTSQLVLFDPVSKESEKEVIFDVKNVD